MKRIVFITFLFAFFASEVVAAPYSVIRKVQTNGACQTYFVDVYDNRNTPDPTDDLFVTSGVVTNCTSSDLQNNTSFYTDLSASNEKTATTGEMLIEQIIEPDQYIIPVEDLNVTLNSEMDQVVVDLLGFNPVLAIIQHENGKIADQYSLSDPGKDFTFNTANLEPGNYIISMYDREKLRTARIIIE